MDTYSKVGSSCPRSKALLGAGSVPYCRLGRNLRQQNTRRASWIMGDGMSSYCIHSINVHTGQMMFRVRPRLSVQPRSDVSSATWLPQMNPSSSASLRTYSSYHLFNSFGSAMLDSDLSARKRRVTALAVQTGAWASGVFESRTPERISSSQA